MLVERSNHLGGHKLNSGQIGLAQRMAISQGLNRELDADLRDPAKSQYNIIDRKTSTMIGATPNIRNESIAASIPPMSEANENDMVFSLHVKMSSHLGNILDGK